MAEKKVIQDDVIQDELSTGEMFRRRQHGKNIALGLAVGGLCLLFYVISIVRMGPAV